MKEVPPESIRALLRAAFPDAEISDLPPQMKISPNSSIHVIKFKLDESGIDLTGEEINAITSHVRAGHRKPSAYLDSNDIRAIADHLRSL